MVARVSATSEAVTWREVVGVSAVVALPSATDVAYELNVKNCDLASLVIATGVMTLTGEAVAAEGELSVAVNVDAGKTVTAGAVVYTFVAELTAANQVLVGVDLATSMSNLAAAINGGAGSGTVYGAGTVANPLVTAAANNFGVVVTAKTEGVAGNAIPLASTITGVVLSGAHLAGGKDAPEKAGGAGKDFEGSTIALTALKGLLVRLNSGKIGMVWGYSSFTLEAPAVFMISSGSLIDEATGGATLEISNSWDTPWDADVVVIGQ